MQLLVKPRGSSSPDVSVIVLNKVDVRLSELIFLGTHLISDLFTYVNLYFKAKIMNIPIIVLKNNKQPSKTKHNGVLTGNQSARHDSSFPLSKLIDP